MEDRDWGAEKGPAARGRLALLAVALAVLAGCASVEGELDQYGWTPGQAQTRLDLQVRLEARHTLGRELEGSSLVIGKEEERAAIQQLVLQDFTQSGLFAGVNLPGRQPDLALDVHTHETMPKGIWTMEIKLTAAVAVQDPSTGAAVREYTREGSLRGMVLKSEMGREIGRMLAEIRQELLADYQAGKLQGALGAARTGRAVQGHLAAAEAAQAKGDYAAALAAVRQARRADPAGAAPAAAAVTLLYRLCDPEGAKRLGEAAGKAHPADAALQAARAGAGGTPVPAACAAQQRNREAVALAREGKRADALAAFQAARQTAPGLVPKASYNAALLLEQTGKPQEALAAYLEARRGFLDPAEEQETLSRLTALAQRASLAVPAAADRRYRLGIVRAQQKRYPEAAAEFEAALAEAPWLADAYYNLGLVYDFIGRSADALQALQSYLSLAPQSPHASAVKTKVVELEDKLGAGGK